MSRLIWLVPVLILLVPPLPAHAQHHWVEVLKGEETTAAIDTSSVVRSTATRVSAWVQWSRGAPMWLTGLQVTGVREYREHDCEMERFRSLGIFLVDRAGTMVDAARDPVQRWEGFEDGSKDVLVLRRVCELGMTRPY